MFTLRVPVLQTGAFTITLPAVIDNLLSDNNSLPFSLILSFSLLLPVRVPVRTDINYSVLRARYGLRSRSASLEDWNAANYTYRAFGERSA